MTNHDICKNKEFYFDLSQMNANTELPCLCFQERSSEAEYYKQTVQANCITLTIPIQILLCIPYKSNSQLISMLWKFREEIMIYLKNKIPQDINPHLTNLRYHGASALESIMWKTGNKYNDNSDFMCSTIAIYYNMEYTI